MPLDPTFLSRIINVKWGGDSTTAAGTLRTGFAGEANYTYCCTMTTSTEKPEWKQTGRYVSSPEPDVLTGFEMGIGCMVYANVGADADGKGGTPTFVAGGAWGSSRGQPARIMASNDGANWINTYSSKGTGAVYRVCWDEQEHAFYAAYQDDSEGDTGGTDTYDVLLRSATGSGWSEVSRKQVGGIGFDLPPNYVNPIVNHGGTKVKDANGNYVPNCFWGYNKATKTLIFPDPPYGAGSDHIGEQLKIEREREDGTKEITKTTLSFDTIWAVAFAGGIWHAAGQKDETSPGQGGTGRIATSTDDGKTWEVTFEGKAGNPIASIASAPTKDFSS